MLKRKKKWTGGVLAFAIASQALVLPAEASASSITAEQLESIAREYMGVPYVWGGTTPNGFDCSGYIQYLFNKLGMSMPRTAAEQYQVGTPVSTENLIKGDLVYFSTYKPGPSHIGIYLGNGQFINASSSKGVSIASLSSSYWSKRYIGAKRVLTNSSSSGTDLALPEADTPPPDNDLAQEIVEANQEVSEPEEEVVTEIFYTTVKRTYTTADLLKAKKKDKNTDTSDIFDIEEKLYQLNADGKTYTVQSGDTLDEIAKHFSMDPERLMMLNEKENKTLHRGEALLINGKVKPSITLLQSDSLTEKENILPVASFKPNESYLLFSQHSIERAEAATVIQYLASSYGKEREKDTSEDTDKLSIEVTDVPNKHWAKSPIEWSIQNNFIKTDKQGMFKPNEDLTTKEANDILTLLLEKYAVPKAQREFIQNSMKNDQEWAYHYIEQLVYNISAAYSPTGSQNLVRANDNIGLSFSGDLLAVKSMSKTRSQ